MSQPERIANLLSDWTGTYLAENSAQANPAGPLADMRLVAWVKALFIATLRFHLTRAGYSSRYLADLATPRIDRRRPHPAGPWRLFLIVPDACPHAAWKAAEAALYKHLHQRQLTALARLVTVQGPEPANAQDGEHGDAVPV